MTFGTVVGNSVANATNVLSGSSRETAVSEAWANFSRTCHNQRAT